MKRKSYLSIFLICSAVLLLLFSCSTDEFSKEITEPVLPSDNNGVLGNIEDVVCGSFDIDDTKLYATRTLCNWDTDKKQYNFTWSNIDENKDQISVFSTQNVMSVYTILSENNSTSAAFTGGGFTLTKDALYYALNKKDLTQQTDMTNILVSYAGQTQDGNDSYAHLAKYNYSAAKAVAEDNDRAHFSFKHLGSIFKFSLTIPSDNDVTCTSMTLLDYNKNDDTRMLYQPTQILDITTSETTDGTYVPYLTNANIPDGKSPDDYLLTLQLKDTKNGNEQGINVNKNTPLNLHMFFPSKKMKGQRMQAIIKTTDPDKNYYIDFSATNFKQGQYYSLSMTMIPAGQLSIRLKVNPDWQLGDTQTRAGQSDPGYDKDVHAPKYLYPYVVLDDITNPLRKLDPIEDATQDDWTLNSEGVYVYKKALAHSYTGTATAGRVYVIASDYKLTLPEILDEDHLKEWAYNIPSENKQDFLKNLYSTPLVTSDKIPFTGTVVGFNTNTPSADVTLYHVAAKVDVQWNATAALSGNVSVDNVKDEELYYFKPTENASNASGSYTVSEPITPGTMYNGRQVFYLPQFANPTYSITTGTDHTNSIQFTPSTTNGWTSWLKANIEIK